jgi:F-type H+-transporting ATPase subunit gamma
MATALEIRHRIRAVQQTRKITNAMYLVASSRMKWVMEHIEYNQLYQLRLRTAMWDIMNSLNGEFLLEENTISHPYFIRRGGQKRTYIVIAGDKGMAGSYNHNILSFAWEQMEPCPDCSLITVGMMASIYFRGRGKQPDIEILNVTQDPSLTNARQIAFEIIDLYDRELTGEVYIVYTQFYGANRCVPTVSRLLPQQAEDYADLKPNPLPTGDIIYVPSRREVFDLLVPQYLIGIVFGALVQAYASEHFSRMNAMRSATRNADEILKRLQLEYNMARQTAITQEITEITGVAEALRRENDKVWN